MAEDRFDPDAPALGEGLYGLDTSVDDARLVAIPVPLDATTSYRPGAAAGPEAILRASRQVDLFDVETGRPWQAGIAMLPIPEALRDGNARARREAVPVIEAGGANGVAALVEAVRRVDAFGAEVNGWVEARADEVLARGGIPCCVGGDHASPYGAIAAVARLHPGVGVLHLDAHADLREAYEGFAWSHASIMWNVTERLDGVARLVQVGVRDMGESEFARIERSRGRIVPYFDAALAQALADGRSWASLATTIVSSLPDLVYLSFDIDGLDPTLCPNTGTPVPGGLSFTQATSLVAAVVRAGKRIVGLDLCEVAPGPDGGEWDGNVGARLLYKMMGWAAVAAGWSSPPSSLRWA